MNFTYTDRARQRAEDFAKLQEVTRRLEEKVLKRFARTTTAEWDRIEDPKAGPLYTLRLSDEEDTGKGALSSDDLRDPELPLRLIWDDLLRTRVDRHLARVRELSSREEVHASEDGR
jgi:hypothetical protein